MRLGNFCSLFYICSFRPAPLFIFCCCLQIPINATEVYEVLQNNFGDVSRSTQMPSRFSSASDVDSAVPVPFAVQLRSGHADISGWHGTEMAASARKVAMWWENILLRKAGSRQQQKLDGMRQEKG